MDTLTEDAVKGHFGTGSVEKYGRLDILIQLTLVSVKRNWETTNAINLFRAWYYG